MQLRYNGVELTLTGYAMLASLQVESSLSTIQEAADLLDQSDRLFLDVLAEARKLGELEITRSLVARILANTPPTLSYWGPPTIRRVAGSFLGGSLVLE